MSRGQGRAYRPTWTEDGATRTARTWWIDYSVHGKRFKENAHTTSQKAALDLLRHRVGDRRAGKLTGAPDSVTLAELRALHEKQYDLDGRRTKRRILEYWDHVEAFFGAETRALDVTTVRLDDYAAARLAQGAALQTTKNERAAVRRGFKLAMEKGLLAAMPVFKLPAVRNARSGFFEEGDFAALLLELPVDVRPVVEFLHATGWRVSEALTLVWDAIDWEGHIIRLAERATKGGEARVFPFGEAPSLKALLEARWAARDGLWVFHRGGKRIRDFRHAWASACARAGCAGRLVHDLRRTAARDMRRAGISEGEIMRLCGWRTRSMFDRYNIIDEQDLARAVARRFSGQGAAKSEPSADPA
jgi:integrase